MHDVHSHPASRNAAQKSVCCVHLASLKIEDRYCEAWLRLKSWSIAGVALHHQCWGWHADETKAKIMGVGKKVLHFTCSNLPALVLLPVAAWTTVSCHL